MDQAKKAAGEKNVYLLGGPSVAQACLRAGLVDGVMLHVVPVLFGEGIRLFDNLGDEDLELEPGTPQALDAFPLASQNRVANIHSWRR